MGEEHGEEGDGGENERQEVEAMAMAAAVREESMERRRSSGDGGRRRSRYWNRTGSRIRLGLRTNDGIGYRKSRTEISSLGKKSPPEISGSKAHIASR